MFCSRWFEVRPLLLFGGVVSGASFQATFGVSCVKSIHVHSLCKGAGVCHSENSSVLGQVTVGPEFCCLSIWANLEVIREMDCYKVDIIIIQLAFFYYSNDYINPDCVSLDFGLWEHQVSLDKLYRSFLQFENGVQSVPVFHTKQHQNIHLNMDQSSQFLHSYDLNNVPHHIPNCFEVLLSVSCIDLGEKICP